MAKKRTSDQQAVVDFVLRTIKSETPEKFIFIQEQFDISLKELMKAGVSCEQLELLSDDIFKSAVELEEVTIDELNYIGMEEERLKRIFNSQQIFEEFFVEPEVFTPSFIDHQEKNFIDKIRDREVELIEVRAALIEHRLSDAQLMNELGYSSELIERIRNFTPQNAYFPSILELPPLRNDATDVYFLGMPRSGKSTMLASFLHFCNRKGMLKNVIDNSHGTKYKNQLVKGMAQGYLPDSTPTELINFIPIDIRSRENQEIHHKLNFIDMAGEKFKNVAEGGMQKFKMIKEYLSNNNRKSLIFVLDYFRNDSAIELLEQDQNLQEVFAQLESFGILEKTDFIYMIVTKADLFPSENKQEFADNYIDEHYVNFSMACKEAKRKYSVQIKSFPYSIGPSILTYLLEDKNPVSNKNLDVYPGLLVDQILEDTHQTKKGFRFW